MKVLWSVLSEFVDLDGLSPYEVSEALINSGLEVEDVEDLSKKLQGTVSVVINRISPHPYSPSLSVLDLSDGFCNYRVVCGARNINEGDIVILCKPGAILPDGTLVSEREIRGVLSQGMLLSEIEIGTDPCATGVLVFDRTTPVGLDGARLVYYDDFVLSVAPTPNRGDLLGVIGVAREVSALFSRELKMPSIDIYDDSSHVESVTDVIIEDSDLCKRYVAKFFDDVKIGPSPLWMKVRLLHFGMRPICNVVDVTNYVMMEFGQPLHAFDFDKLKGGKIVVRRARYGESIETLDGKLRELSTQDLVIADLERPVAIAGIMGGANTEVTEFTTRVLLESAYFDPVAIRKTAKAFGISTEASRRFERGVDIEGLYFAALRAATLIKETSGAKVYKGVIDRYPGRDGTRQIFFDPSYVSDFLGAKIDANESKKILVSLGFDVDDSRIPWLVKVPSWRRLDVTREVDLVEEVARVWGYDKIPDELPKGSLQRERPYSTYDFVTSIKRFMSALGLMEVITFSFIPGDFGKRLGESFGQLVFLENPISEEMSVMRPTLIYGLLDT
ncbi:MAG: phenylalanine--tRNA ligase subunit beta, partial [candidate division WOR-3 bacterium]